MYMYVKIDFKFDNTYQKVFQNQAKEKLQNADNKLVAWNMIFNLSTPQQTKLC